RGRSDHRPQRVAPTAERSGAGDRAGELVPSDSAGGRDLDLFEDAGGWNRHRRPWISRSPARDRPVRADPAAEPDAGADLPERPARGRRLPEAVVAPAGNDAVGSDAACLEETGVERPAV